MPVAPFLWCAPSSMILSSDTSCAVRKDQLQNGEQGPFRGKDMDSGIARYDRGGHREAFHPGRSVDKLCNLAVSLFDLKNEPIVTTDAYDGPNHQIAPQENQGGTKDEQRQEQMHHLIRIIISRSADEDAQHGERQGKNGYSRAHCGKRCPLFRQKELDFVDDDSYARSLTFREHGMIR